MISAEKVYYKRKKAYGNLLKNQNKIIKILSLIRIIVFLVGLISVFAFYYVANSVLLSIVAFAIFALIFIVVAIKHEKFIKNRDLTVNIYDINIQCIERIEGKWKEFKDIGEEYIDENHPYSNDLDIFGRASLFQYINDTTTYVGREILRKTLENSHYSEEEIYKRQSSIKEISNKIGFRQRLKGEGLRVKESSKNVLKLLHWAKERDSFYDNKLLCLVTIILPVLTLAAVIYYLLGIFKTYYIPMIFIIINFLVLRIKKEERNKALNTVYFYKKQINQYYNMLKHIEKMNFSTAYLKEIQENLKDESSTASKNIKKLNVISDFIQDRKNLMYFILNYIFLWDYHCMINLEKWKKFYGEKLKSYLDTIGVMEELSSLSILSFDNPRWAMPRFKEDEFMFKGESMGHPLLGEKRICNDLTIDKNKKIILITGSNMSGKSTFLRTAGINLVLAYSGAPVCAKNFICSKMEIFTCMRTSDNLEKNISSFYGELIRIKELVKKVKEDRKIFFLLDEIFKGTNSIDRHTGAKVLINKLSKKEVIGMVSTHDLELGSLDKENSYVKNYHFEEYYKNNNIYFDYKLRTGISNTRNAIYLMKIAGIVDGE